MSQHHLPSQRIFTRSNTLRRKNNAKGSSQFRRTRIRTWLLIVSALLCAQAFGSSANATLNHTHLQSYSRESLSLNGQWKIIVDPYEVGYYNYRYQAFDQQDHLSASAFYADAKAKSSADLIEYDFDLADSLQVPGDWNTQTDKLYYYEGSVWYRRTFSVPKSLLAKRAAKNKESKRSFISFGGVNYRADVYLNGRKLGVHEGGFTPFSFEVTDHLKTQNSLVVKVDNKRKADGVPTLNTDWWNYGGITRDVRLVHVPKNFIRQFSLALQHSGNNLIEGQVIIDKPLPGKKAEVHIPELGISKSFKVPTSGKLNFQLEPAELVRWSPANPKRYDIEVRYAGDRLQETMGFRTIETKGKRLLLNGEDIFLRGISVHEEYAAKGAGRVRTQADAQALLDWARALGCNFIRLAHYPHNEHIVRLAEAQGMLVWSEVPVYWTIHWENPTTFENAKQQLGTMIQRDINRSNIIIWSLANETPVSKARNQFLGKLAEYARSLDSSRLLSAAMEKHYDQSDATLAIVEDPLAELVDIVSFNQYVGWYDGLPEKAQTIRWHIPYNKPVFISEFGGGAKFGLHGKESERWTEEFQAALYRENLAMLDKIDGLVGMSPWILADFRSPRRLHSDIQNDFNRKGLLSEKGEKKKAFYVLRDYYKLRE